MKRLPLKSCSLLSLRWSLEGGDNTRQGSVPETVILAKLVLAMTTPMLAVLVLSKCLTVPLTCDEKFLYRPGAFLVGIVTATAARERRATDETVLSKVKWRDGKESNRISHTI